MLKLYYVPGTCAVASYIAWNGAEADYEAARFEFTNLTKLPCVIEHRQRMSERDSAKQALAEQPRELAA